MNPTEHRSTHESIQAEHPGHSRRYYRLITFFTHLLCLALLFLLPEMLVTLYSPEVDQMPIGIYLKAAIYATVFYVNFYFIIDRTLLPHPQFSRFALYNTILVTAALLALYIVWHYIDPGGKPLPEEYVPNKPIPQSVTGSAYGQERPEIVLSRDFIILVLTIALSIAIRLNYSWIKMEHNRREMESLRKEMELAQLRTQLSPHFLFNTLNGIYALIDIAPGKAQTAIHRLSKMLRYLLYESRTTVTIRQEIAFLSDYIELMKLRLPEGFPLSVSLDCSQAPDMQLQPMLFINIIENAFKYGMTASEEQMIDIRITAQPPTATCICTNTYSEEASRLSRKNNSSGIGLSNLRRRLELRYPAGHRLEIDDNGERFTAILSIDTSTPPLNS